MLTTKTLKYGLAGVVVAAIALYAGMPAFFLVLLLCPLMMFFMMSSMTSGHADSANDSSEAPKAPTP